jgi:hypothetical protein
MEWSGGNYNRQYSEPTGDNKRVPREGMKEKNMPDVQSITVTFSEPDLFGYLGLEGDNPRDVKERIEAYCKEAKRKISAAYPGAKVTATASETSDDDTYRITIGGKELEVDDSSPQEYQDVRKACQAKVQELGGDWSWMPD